MYRLINRNAAMVVDKLRRLGDLRDYVQLRSDLTGIFAANSYRIPLQLRALKAEGWK